MKRVSGITRKASVASKQPKPEGMNDDEFAQRLTQEKAAAQNNCEFLETSGFNVITVETDPKNRMSEIEKYTVFKGSITIEGVSLTVAKLEGNRCTIAIIPHTVEMTNLGSLKPGDPVNLEADLIAKYVEKMMRRKAAESHLTIEELVRQGF